jgi:hypothetical protein
VFGEPGTGRSARYVLTDAGRQTAASGQPISPGQGARPRQKTVGLRERAWWEIRAKKTVSLKQILSTHADGSEKSGAINLYKYLLALEKAGLLARLGKRIPAKQSRGRVQWALERDPGPKSRRHSAGTSPYARARAAFLTPKPSGAAAKPARTSPSRRFRHEPPARSVSATAGAGTAGAGRAPVESELSAAA